MPLSKAALQRVKTILSMPHAEPAGGRGRVNVPFPILSEEQIRFANEYAKSYGARRGKRRGGGGSGAGGSYAARKARSAAVLVPICNVGGEPSIIFTLRSSTVSTHKNQISFPGGHVEPSDASMAQTAIRETEEELRGSYDYENRIDVLGETGRVPAITGTMVTPVVAAMLDDFRDAEHLRRVFHNSSRDEVDVVFARSLEDLVESESSEPLERLPGSFGPIYPGPEGKIWGLTAIILRPLLRKVFLPAFFGDSGKGRTSSSSP